MDDTRSPAAFTDLARRSWQQWQEMARGGPVIMVGAATCGRAAGALAVLDTIRNELSRHGRVYPVFEVGCMGHCYAEPIVVISKPGYPSVVFGPVNDVIVRRLVTGFVLGDDPCLEFALGALEENDAVPALSSFPRARFERKLILKNCGFIDPENIEHYIARGGYSALEKALQTSPEAVVDEVRHAGLRGRGGAGFATSDKWAACRDARGRPKYLIANADEGDPGAFIDRALLESDPHSVVEGMLIAGYAVGARYGYIYVRAEYPLAVRRAGLALRQARRLNLLGRHILGSDFSFDIRLFQGSGAFVCGEETALIASLEGRAGTPRHRPPYPATEGLRGKPTVVNNVKTLAYLPFIIGEGAAAFRSIGTKNSPGTAVFALAGKVVNTGLAEVPMGTTLRQVIFDVGSGFKDGKRFKAVQVGGPSGGCLPESALDLPIDFDSLSGAGAMMGSGGMIVLDEDDCMVEMARYFQEFTQQESCGKCTFCRLGTKQMLAILDDITRGQGSPEDIEGLRQLAGDIKDGSLCGLGRTAPNPVLSTLRYFGDEYEAHIKEGRCPALMCPELIAYYIIPERCERSCDACVGTCTVEAISSHPKKRYKIIDQEKCVKCGTCLTACPPQYRAVVKLSPPDLLPEAGKR